MTNGQSCLQQGKSLSDFLIKKRHEPKLTDFVKGGTPQIFEESGEGAYFSQCSVHKDGPEMGELKICLPQLFLDFYLSRQS